MQKNMDKKMIQDLKTAVLFAVSFVLLAVVINIWQANIHAAFKMLAIAGYGLYLLRVFTPGHLTTFAGFSVMLLGLNYIWADQSIESTWKIAAGIAVLLQLSTLGESKIATEQQ
jgi:hypothetical protein